MAEHVTKDQKKIELLTAALKEAGDFAVRRLPHDSRETFADSLYFQTMWLDCAAEQLKNERGEKNVEYTISE